MKVLILFLTLQLSGFGLPLLAGAAMVETRDLLAREDATGRIERIRATLSDERLRQAFLNLGVEPAAVEGRLDGLTAEELSSLEAGLTGLPAGGDSVLAIIGVVFLVLLILEIVGVTDIFKKV